MENFSKEINTKQKKIGFNKKPGTKNTIYEI
jgi:hypothetical protein